MNQSTKRNLNVPFMSSAKEPDVDEPQSHCATVNNMMVMNGLSSLYLPLGKPEHTGFLCSKTKKKQNSRPPKTLFPAAVYELYIILYI